MTPSKWYQLSSQARQDIRWWYEFLSNFKGSSIMWLIDAEETDSEMSMDASLKGTGGCQVIGIIGSCFPLNLQNRS